MKGLALVLAVPLLFSCSAAGNEVNGSRNRMERASARAVADYERDGKQDTAYIHGTTLYVRWNGDSRDETVVAEGVPASASISAADVDGDGDIDIGVYPVGLAPSVYLNVGRRQFVLRPPR